MSYTHTSIELNEIEQSNKVAHLRPAAMNMSTFLFISFPISPVDHEYFKFYKHFIYHIIIDLSVMSIKKYILEGCISSSSVCTYVAVVVVIIFFNSQGVSNESVFSGDFFHIFLVCNSSNNKKPLQF